MIAGASEERKLILGVWLSRQADRLVEIRVQVMHGFSGLGQYGLIPSVVRRNLEAGVLVTGGAAPQRAAEHIRELQRRGVLRPLPG